VPTKRGPEHFVGATCIFTIRQNLYVNLSDPVFAWKALANSPVYSRRTSMRSVAFRSTPVVVFKRAFERRIRAFSPSDTRGGNRGKRYAE
jgi:hypothetical protein